MAEESDGGTRDSRGRFRRKKDDAEATADSTDDGDDDPGITDDDDDDPASAEDGGDDPASAEDGKEEVDISGTSAPSIGPHTTIEYESPQSRMARSTASDTDAMGLDKRRQVVGQSYGPSVARQLTVYGGFLAVMSALVIGFLLLAKQLDKAPASYEDKAPWAAQDAEQQPPARLE